MCGGPEQSEGVCGRESLHGDGRGGENEGKGGGSCHAGLQLVINERKGETSSFH